LLIINFADHYVFFIYTQLAHAYAHTVNSACLGGGGELHNTHAQICVDVMCVYRLFLLNR